MADSCHVTVAVRIRPMVVAKEDVLGDVPPCLFADEENKQGMVIVNPKDKTSRERERRFVFDRVFDSSRPDVPNFATQQCVFEEIGKQVVDNAFDGYNTCLFAYGQTGSGKTHTMMGSLHDSAQRGVSLRLCEDMFMRMATREDGWTFSVEVTYFEIYNENVYDLLAGSGAAAAVASTGMTPRGMQTPRSAAASAPSPPRTQSFVNNRSALRVREDPQKGPFVEGITTKTVTTFDDLIHTMHQGGLRRSTASTGMNAVSSRSHSIITIRFTQVQAMTSDMFEGVDLNSININNFVTSLCSKINLVDLAGSERLQHAGTERIAEGSKINLSLTSLGIVMSALAESTTNPEKAGMHIPYRNSSLTWLLCDSLGGNSKTFLISTVNPANEYYDETISTLRFAERAKRIVLKPKVNEDPNLVMWREVQEQLDAMRAKMANAQQNNQESEELKERLRQSEQMKAEMEKEWAKRMRHIVEKHELEKMHVKVEADTPAFVNLSHNTSDLLFYAVVGTMLVGSDKHKCQVVLTGLEPVHCEIECTEDFLVYVTPMPGTACYVNGTQVSTRTRLAHKDNVVFHASQMYKLRMPGDADVESFDDWIDEAENAKAQWLSAHGTLVNKKEVDKQLQEKEAQKQKALEEREREIEAMREKYADLERQLAVEKKKQNKMVKSHMQQYYINYAAQQLIRHAQWRRFRKVLRQACDWVALANHIAVQLDKEIRLAINVSDVANDLPAIIHSPFFSSMRRPFLPSPPLIEIEVQLHGETTVITDLNLLRTFVDEIANTYNNIVKGSLAKKVFSFRDHAQILRGFEQSTLALQKSSTLLQSVKDNALIGVVTLGALMDNKRVHKMHKFKVPMYDLYGKPIANVWVAVTEINVQTITNKDESMSFHRRTASFGTEQVDFTMQLYGMELLEKDEPLMKPTRRGSLTRMPSRVNMNVSSGGGGGVSAAAAIRNFVVHVLIGDNEGLATLSTDGQSSRPQWTKAFSVHTTGSLPLAAELASKCVCLSAAVQKPSIPAIRTSSTFTFGSGGDLRAAGVRSTIRVRDLPVQHVLLAVDTQVLELASTGDWRPCPVSIKTDTGSQISSVSRADVTQLINVHQGMQHQLVFFIQQSAVSPVITNVLSVEVIVEGSTVGTHTLFSDKKDLTRGDLSNLNVASTDFGVTFTKGTFVVVKNMPTSSLLHQISEEPNRVEVRTKITLLTESGVPVPLQCICGLRVCKRDKKFKRPEGDLVTMAHKARQIFDFVIKSTKKEGRLFDSTTVLTTDASDEWYDGNLNRAEHRQVTCLDLQHKLIHEVYRQSIGWVVEDLEGTKKSRSVASLSEEGGDSTTPPPTRMRRSGSFSRQRTTVDIHGHTMGTLHEDPMDMNMEMSLNVSFNQPTTVKPSSRAENQLHKFELASSFDHTRAETSCRRKMSVHPGARHRGYMHAMSNQFFTVTVSEHPIQVVGKLMASTTNDVSVSIENEDDFNASMLVPRKCQCILYDHSLVIVEALVAAADKEINGVPAKNLTTERLVLIALPHIMSVHHSVSPGSSTLTIKVPAAPTIGTKKPDPFSNNSIFYGAVPRSGTGTLRSTHSSLSPHHQDRMLSPMHKEQWHSPTNAVNPSFASSVGSTTVAPTPITLTVMDPDEIVVAKLEEAAAQNQERRSKEGEKHLPDTDSGDEDLEAWESM